MAVNSYEPIGGWSEHTDQRNPWKVGGNIDLNIGQFIHCTKPRSCGQNELQGFSPGDLRLYFAFKSSSLTYEKRHNISNLFWSSSNIIFIHFLVLWGSLILNQPTGVNSKGIFLQVRCRYFPVTFHHQFKREKSTLPHSLLPWFSPDTGIMVKSWQRDYTRRSPESKKLNWFSAPVIIEMRALWLVENCAISRYNHLARDDYSWGAKFQNGCFAFCQWYTKSDERYGRIYNSKEHKSAIQFGVTLFKRKIWSFCWFNREDC